MLNRLSNVGMVFCGVSMVFFTGCAPVKVAPMTNYTLTNSTPTASSVNVRTQSTLLVSIPNANSGYDSEKMIYVMVPYQLRSYINNQWVAPPAQLLQGLFAQKLQSSCFFKAVVTAPFAGTTGYRLDTQLVMLQQEFFHPISQIHLVVQATVVNTNSNQVIASHRFEALVDTQENTPYAGVLAANIAANQISQQISSFTTRAVNAAR